MDWEKYWSDKSDDRHTDPTPEGIAKEGREKLLHLGSGDRLLDVGCGTGKLISHYTANFRECIGVERSPTMLAEAQRNLRDTNIALLHGSSRERVGNSGRRFRRHHHGRCRSIPRLL